MQMQVRPQLSANFPSASQALAVVCGLLSVSRRRRIILDLRSLLLGNFAAALRQARLNRRIAPTISILGGKRATCRQLGSLNARFCQPSPKTCSRKID
jgi:hypothetical protein